MSEPRPRGVNAIPGLRRIDPVVFLVTATAVVAIVIWGLTGPDSMEDVTDTGLDWVVENLGWLFIIATLVFVIFAVFLAVSRYGTIPLGKDGEEPEFKTISWIAMMFSAGMGIGLMFYGAQEPLSHFLTPPPGADPAVSNAMANTMFHWGFHPWAVYGVVGLAIAYSTFRLERSQLFSAVFAPFYRRGGTGGAGAKVIDILAIFATLFGTTASLGLGALQISAGLDRSNWVHEPSKMVLVAIIAVLTLAFIASAVSGVAKGIQWLSNINMVAALALALFVFVVGPTVFILNVLPSGLGQYLNDFTSMAARSGAENQETENWLAGWTIFYWAWWVSWAPFVGLFLAKISRGRTIRQFVLGVMVVPSAVSLVWFAVFGGTAIHQSAADEPISVDAPEATLFDLLANLPWFAMTAGLVMFLVAIFFVSGADSASLVMGTLSERGAPEPSRTITVFWGTLTGTVAAVLLVSSEDSLSSLQTMTILAAVPFVVVMLAMCLALLIDLRRDPLMQAHRQLDDAHRDVVLEAAAEIIETIEDQEPIELQEPAER